MQESQPKFLVRVYGLLICPFTMDTGSGSTLVMLAPFRKAEKEGKLEHSEMHQQRTMTGEPESAVCVRELVLSGMSREITHSLQRSSVKCTCVPRSVCSVQILHASLHCFLSLQFSNSSSLYEV